MKAGRLRKYASPRCSLFVAWWRRYDVNVAMLGMARLSEALHRQLVAHSSVVSIPRDVVLYRMRFCVPFHTLCSDSFYVAGCARQMNWV